MGREESDRLIIPAQGNAITGKGATRPRSLQREHEPDMKGWNTSCKPHCGE